MKYGLPPIADKRATILILGTMPGEESLEKNEYYANPRNVFWKIMAELFGFRYDENYKESYEKRTRILKENKIALWDVMEACERQGSLDSAIKKIIENDFESFYRDHPNIRSVFFNGAKAEKAYFDKVWLKLSKEAKRIKCCRLPSTSPAMARMNFDEKLSEWSEIKRKI